MEGKAIRRNKITTMRSDSKSKCKRNKNKTMYRKSLGGNISVNRECRIGIDHIKYLVSNP
jgi:hypothetical protein